MSKRTKKYKIHRIGEPTILIEDFTFWYKKMKKQKNVKAVYEDIFMSWLLLSLSYKNHPENNPDDINKKEQVLNKIKDIKKIRNRLYRELIKKGNAKKILELEQEVTKRFHQIIQEQLEKMGKENEKKAKAD
jgi:hypothetical protein